MLQVVRKAANLFVFIALTNTLQLWQVPLLYDAAWHVGKVCCNRHMRSRQLKQLTQQGHCRIQSDDLHPAADCSRQRSHRHLRLRAWRGARKRRTTRSLDEIPPYKPTDCKRLRESSNPFDANATSCSAAHVAPRLMATHYPYP
jgi:hypothetical protein